MNVVISHAMPWSRRSELRCSQQHQEEDECERVWELWVQKRMVHRETVYGRWLDVAERGCKMRAVSCHCVCSLRCLRVWIYEILKRGDLVRLVEVESDCRIHRAHSCGQRPFAHARRPIHEDADVGSACCTVVSTLMSINCIIQLTSFLRIWALPGCVLDETENRLADYLVCFHVMGDTSSTSWVHSFLNGTSFVRFKMWTLKLNSGERATCVNLVMPWTSICGYLIW